MLSAVSLSRNTTTACAVAASDCARAQNPCAEPGCRRTVSAMFVRCAVVKAPSTGQIPDTANILGPRSWRPCLWTVRPPRSHRRARRAWTTRDGKPHPAAAVPAATRWLLGLLQRGPRAETTRAPWAPLGWLTAQTVVVCRSVPSSVGPTLSASLTLSSRLTPAAATRGTCLLRPRQSPVAPSSCSRRTSACPRWRAVSSIVCT